MFTRNALPKYETKTNKNKNIKFYLSVPYKIKKAGKCEQLQDA
jgi:hypothetical protein